MLLDTNILLDVILDRYPFSEAAFALLSRLQVRDETAFVAWHSVSNIYYVVSRALGDSEAREFISDFMGFVSVADTGTADIQYAATLPMRDFEDAMQVAAARACGATHIVTRNARDFERSPIPVIGAKEALQLLRSA